MEKPSTHEEGRRGEEVAARFLEDSGWRIVARNIRQGRGEVDLVIVRGPILAFVEVKGRRGSGFGHPLESVTRRKRLEIERVARGWLRGRPPWNGDVRFDAVAVHFRPGGVPLVEHVEDAWRCESPVDGAPRRRLR
jgi:putative endonuclease